MRILLDTNAYSALGRGHPQVTELVRAANELPFSTVVIGEVLAGFRGGNRLESNLADLDRFLSSSRLTILPVTPATADRYSQITDALRRRGRPIPTNDIWIAAHAMETGAELVSFDPHFEYVEGLAWVQPER